MILLAYRSVCWSNDLRADPGRTLQAVSVLEANGVEPTGYGECTDALDEGVIESEQDVITDSKGIEFP